MEDLLEKLEKMSARFGVLEEEMSRPEVVQDVQQLTALSKEYKKLEPIIDVYTKYRNQAERLSQSRQFLKEEQDNELRQMAKEEIEALKEGQTQLEEQLKGMLVEEDPLDERNAILEIRAGTGGEEAALFAADLFRMYVRYTEKKGWRVSPIDQTEASVGGYKELILSIYGAGAYGQLRYESGVHRVQRVPLTETQGRVHTSAVSVVVLPEMEEVDVSIDMNDVRKDTYCSSGPGGQSVNTTYSAVRLTHLPTNVVVTCQDEKSQLKNLEKALKVLRARLHKLETEKQQQNLGAQRRNMIGSGDRSDKIRTYNYPQGRVTDHRVSYTTHHLSAFMDGHIQPMIDRLRLGVVADKLSST